MLQSGALTLPHVKYSHCLESHFGGGDTSKHQIWSWLLAFLIPLLTKHLEGRTEDGNSEGVLGILSCYRRKVRVGHQEKTCFVSSP